MVERRWHAGLRNLPMYQRAATRWTLLDNTRGGLKAVACGGTDAPLDVRNAKVYAEVMRWAQ